MRKALTSVLLRADTEEVVAVGKAAREKFRALFDDENGAENK
jgi:hypothetical protein